MPKISKYQISKPDIMKYGLTPQKYQILTNHYERWLSTTKISNIDKNMQQGGYSTPYNLIKTATTEPQQGVTLRNV